MTTLVRGRALGGEDGLVDVVAHSRRVGLWAVCV